MTLAQVTKKIGRMLAYSGIKLRLVGGRNRVRIAYVTTARYDCDCLLCTISNRIDGGREEYFMYRNQLTCDETKNNLHNAMQGCGRSRRDALTVRLIFQHYKRTLACLNTLLPTT